MLINLVGAIRPVKKSNNTKNNTAAQYGGLRQLNCDTVQFSGIKPLKSVHHALSKKAIELEVVLANTASRDDAISLRNVIDDLTSGHYSGTILGDESKNNTRTDYDFLDGDLVRTVCASTQTKAKTVTDHLPTGDCIKVHNVKGTLVKEVVNHPDTLKPNASVFYDMHTGVPYEERGTELDGSLRFLSTRFPSYDRDLSPALGIKGSKFRYDCSVNGQLKSSKVMDAKNQLLATLHYRDDKTLDFARVFDPKRKSVVKVVDFDEEGIVPVKTEIM